MPLGKLACKGRDGLIVLTEVVTGRAKCAPSNYLYPFLSLTIDDDMRPANEL